MARHTAASRRRPRERRWRPSAGRDRVASSVRHSSSRTNPARVSGCARTRRRPRPSRRRVGTGRGGARACTATSADFATTSLPGRRRTMARRPTEAARGTRAAPTFAIATRLATFDDGCWRRSARNASRPAPVCSTSPEARASSPSNSSTSPASRSPSSTRARCASTSTSDDSARGSTTATAPRPCARAPDDLSDASLAAPAHLRLYFHAGLWTGTRESRRNDAAEARVDARARHAMVTTRTRRG